MEPRVFSDHVLASSYAGAIVRCPCCGDLEVRFDGVAVTLTRDELARMRATVGALVARPGAVWTWELRTRTAKQDVTFSLWGDSALELDHLLEHALAVLAIERVVADALAAPIP